MARELNEKKKHKNCNFCIDKVDVIDYKDVAKIKKGYKLKPDGKILINVAHGLDADETVKKVQEELSLEDTKEINRKEAAWCTRIWLSR